MEDVALALERSYEARASEPMFTVDGRQAPVAIDRKKWSSGPTVEAVKALKTMFLVENFWTGIS